MDPVGLSLLSFPRRKGNGAQVPAPTMMHEPPRPALSVARDLDLAEEFKDMAKEEFANPKPPRTLEVVRAELKTNTADLKRVVVLGQNLMALDAQLRTELVPLMAEEEAAQEAAKADLDELKAYVALTNPTASTDQQPKGSTDGQT